jgi:ubiquinone/menaquinone biosynthesis C-methylase UbiE
MLFRGSEGYRAHLKEFRRWLYSVLAADPDVQELRFMNYGFVPDAGGENIPLDPGEEAHRRQIQLYRELVRPVDLQNKRVLEVGCGRGGGAVYLAHHMGPKSYVALDWTRHTIRASGNLCFLVGNAECLPFPDESFDVVLSLESSHCYHPIEKFLEGARRVLVSGGFLLLADFRDLIGVGDLRRAMFASGLTLLEEKNITRNVFEAMKQRSLPLSQAIVRSAPEHLWALFREFAGVRGSAIFRAMENDEARYMSYVLQKFSAY